MTNVNDRKSEFEHKQAKQPPAAISTVVGTLGGGTTSPRPAVSNSSPPKKRPSDTPAGGGEATSKIPHHRKKLDKKIYDLDVGSSTPPVKTGEVAGPLASHLPDLGSANGMTRSYRDVLLGIPSSSTKPPNLNNPASVVGDMEEEELDWEDSDEDSRENRRRLEGREPEGKKNEVSRKVEEDGHRILRIEVDRLPREPERITWLSDGSRDALSGAVLPAEKEDEGRCKYCGYTATKKRVRVHVRQHFARYYCRCGMNRTSRDTVVEHVKRNRGQESHSSKVHEVDRPTYPVFARSMGWTNPPVFPECRPTLSGPPGYDARDTIREKLQIKGLRFDPPKKQQAPVKESRVEVTRKRSHQEDSISKKSLSKSPEKSKKKDKSKKSSKSEKQRSKEESKSQVKVSQKKSDEPERKKKKEETAEVRLEKSPNPLREEDESKKLSDGKRKSSEVRKLSLAEPSRSEEPSKKTEVSKTVVDSSAGVDDSSPPESSRPSPAVPSSSVNEGASTSQAGYPSLARTRPQTNWRVEMMAGIALFRQQATQFHLQAVMADRQARMANERADQMEAALKAADEGDGRWY